MSPRPWHEVLEVAPDADPDRVRRAFRRLAVLHQGDRERFAEITAAYEASGTALPPAPADAPPPADVLDNIFRATFGKPPPSRSTRGLWLALATGVAALVAIAWALGFF